MRNFLTILLGLIALVILGLMCTRCHKPMIIQDLESNVTTKLAGLGITDLMVNHPEDGRDVVLEGVVATQEDKERAGREALAARGVNSVDNRLRVLAAPAAVPEPVAAEVAAAEPEPAPEPTPAAINCQAEFNQALQDEDVRFDTDSDRIQSSSYPLLDRLAEAAEKCPNANIEIGGHTDPRATAAYNLDLSQRRADSVREYLISKGVSGSRVTARGYGETQPLTSDTSEAGLQRNRRVELNVEGVN